MMSRHCLQQAVYIILCLSSLSGNVVQREAKDIYFYQPFVSETENSNTPNEESKPPPTNNWASKPDISKYVSDKHSKNNMSQVVIPEEDLGLIPVRSSETSSPLATPVGSNGTSTPLATPVRSNETSTPLITPVQPTEVSTPLFARPKQASTPAIGLIPAGTNPSDNIISIPNTVGPAGNGNRYPAVQPHDTTRRPYPNKINHNDIRSTDPLPPKITVVEIHSQNPSSTLPVVQKTMPVQKPNESNNVLVIAVKPTTRAPNPAVNSSNSSLNQETDGIIVVPEIPKRRCKTAKKPDHGHVTCNNENTRCRITCEPEYKLDGEERITCQDGKWSDKEPTLCTRRGCESAKKPDNGHVTCNHENTRCRFTCEPEYKLDGEKRITCQDGKWSSKEPTCTKKDRPIDCASIKKKHPNTPTKMYEIWPKLMNKPIQVQCDMATDSGGWTIFQKRGDFSEKENFFRPWNDYVNGFGERRHDKEYWIGLDAIHAITNNEPQILRIDMEDFDGKRRFAKYANFSVGSGSDFKLEVRGYSGDAGDSLWVHNNMKFSTKDAGNTYCANLYKGAWWYNFCHHSNLNGKYNRGFHASFADGINWLTFRGWYYSLKTSEMKMRPKSY